LGKAIVLCRTKDDIGHWAHVVGVAADVHQYGLERPAPPEAYVPYTRDAGNASTLIIRSSLPLAVVSGLVESTLARVAPSVPIENQRSMESYLSESMAQRRMTLELFAAFTGLALALAGLGIYGVVAFTTSRRTGEIGLRLTLGARPAEIVRLVVAGSLRPALVGIMIGAAAALLAGRAFTALVYRVSPADPETLAAAVAALLAIALLAAWLPAWRASRIDPASALRAE
jgi:putative ABC transport system permease protein